ncbi:unnamed protein product [Caenorhabditis brenneri]
MTDILQTNDIFYRHCILYEALHKKTVEEAYRNMKEVMPTLDFLDFQYWYFRFLNGNLDLNYERSKDQKTLLLDDMPIEVVDIIVGEVDAASNSEPRPVQFSDLPLDVVGCIVSKLGFMERFMLRRVSKPLREFIEKQVFDCTSIDGVLCDDFICVSYGNEEVQYAKNDETGKLYKNESGICETIIYEDESEICDDLACVLKNPKLQLCSFGFWPPYPSHEDEVLSTFLTKLEYALKSLKHKIAVRKLELRTGYPENFLAILPYLKPGYLETIAFDCKEVADGGERFENSRKVEEIIQLDQTKQAKELILRNSFRCWFPEEVFAQFEKYWINTWILSTQEFLRIANKFADSPVFVSCRFHIFYPAKVYDLLDSIGVPGPAAEGYSSVRHYEIPHTDKLLVFKEHPDGEIDIEKKTRDIQ